MKLWLLLCVALAISSCTNKSNKVVPERFHAEAVAIEYAERKFGHEFFDPDGKGYEINVIECGERLCISLHPANDPKTGLPRGFRGGVDMELRKSDLAVLKAFIVQ